MCGICGVAGGDPTRHRADVERICAAMVHRGPDDEGFVAHDDVALGMRRLSIIDLAGGHQPMCNEDSTVWVVQNGEIYNHLELREQLIAAGHAFKTQSDTEVLVHGYEEWGEGLVGRLNGMFAFAVHDRRSRVVFLARDRMGIKPLYHAVDREALYFASELKALLCVPALRRGVDPIALDEYLAYEFVPSPRSIVRGISKLRPGHTLTWSIPEAKAVVKRYWAPRLNAGNGHRDVDHDAAELLEVLRESVRKELISDVPLGVFLSGGIDSSAVAAMMTQLGVDVQTFSVGFAEKSFDESSHARAVAQRLGTDHHEITLDPSAMLSLIPRLPQLLDEPLGDASIIPTYLLSAFTREHVKVALGGDGGDELFAGYPTLQAHRLAGYYTRVPRAVRRALVEPVVRRLPVSRANLSFDFRAKRFIDGADLSVAERHRTWMGSFPSRSVPADEDYSSLDPLNHVLMLDMRFYLEGDILMKLDRASMMASLEARVPLLNNDFVAFATSLPMNLKLRGLQTKYLLKRALRGVLPARILDRPKKGFGIPVAEWFRGPLREQMLSALSAERIKRDGLLDTQEVSTLIDEHLSGRRDNRKQLWTLFAFQMWHEGYVSSTPR
ncbi:MAG TPA: asparagine synthase (glutamine-hydrolyzing) [Candidatus Dormibacteraeota bacterium]|nr:asparagine synthase (glutamine-hydrolyzing) [Candidatus Dormibacteraeota bacterium]